MFRQTKIRRVVTFELTLGDLSYIHEICDMRIRVFERVNCKVPLISCKTRFRKRFHCHIVASVRPLAALAREKLCQSLSCASPPPSDANNMSSCRRWKSSYLMHNITGKEGGGCAAAICIGEVNLPHNTLRNTVFRQGSFDETPEEGELQRLNEVFLGLRLIHPL